MSKLYYIENCGCDDTTHGLVRLDDTAFLIFKEIIENLNKNSCYGCMPTIDVYELHEDDIEEITYDQDTYCSSMGAVHASDVLHMDGKTYTLTTSGHGVIYRERDKVI